MKLDVIWPNIATTNPDDANMGDPRYYVKLGGEKEKKYMIAHPKRLGYKVVM